MFYHSVLEGAVFFAALCWSSWVRAADAKRLNKLIKKAGSVLDVKLEYLEKVYKKRMLKKLLRIMDNPSHLSDGPSEYTQQKTHCLQKLYGI